MSWLQPPSACQRLSSRAFEIRPKSHRATIGRLRPATACVATAEPYCRLPNAEVFATGAAVVFGVVTRVTKAVSISTSPAACRLAGGKLGVLRRSDARYRINSAAPRGATEHNGLSAEQGSPASASATVCRGVCASVGVWHLCQPERAAQLPLLRSECHGTPVIGLEELPQHEKGKQLRLCVVPSRETAVILGSLPDPRPAPQGSANRRLPYIPHWSHLGSVESRSIADSGRIPKGPRCHRELCFIAEDRAPCPQGLQSR